MSFNGIQENKMLAKVSEITVQTVPLMVTDKITQVKSLLLIMIANGLAPNRG